MVSSEFATRDLHRMPVGHARANPESILSYDVGPLAFYLYIISKRPSGQKTHKNTHALIQFVEAARVKTSSITVIDRSHLPLASCVLVRSTGMRKANDILVVILTSPKIRPGSGFISEGGRSKMLDLMWLGTFCMSLC